MAVQSGSMFFKLPYSSVYNWVGLLIISLAATISFYCNKMTSFIGYRPGDIFGIEKFAWYIYTNVQKRKVYYSSRSNASTSFQVGCTFRLIIGLFFGVPSDTVLQLQHIGSGLWMVRTTLALQAEQVAVTQLRETHTAKTYPLGMIYPW